MKRSQLMLAGLMGAMSATVGDAVCQIAERQSSALPTLPEKVLDKAAQERVRKAEEKRLRKARKQTTETGRE